MTVSETIGRFLIIVTVLVSVIAAIAWLAWVADTRGPVAKASRGADERVADFSQDLADLLCRKEGTMRWECDRAQRRAAEKRASLNEGDGLGARHVLTLIAVGGVVVTGAWWLAARRKESEPEP